MKSLSPYIVIVALIVASSSVPQARADVTLPKAIASHMVLQRDRPLPIWGWADPGEEVTVKLDEATATTKADDKGNWKVSLPAVKADGKAHRMTVVGKNKIELDDILIGDVWIGSGQSNMEFSLGGSTGGKEAIAKADYAQIRLLHVQKIQQKEPAKDITVAGEKKEQPASAPADASWKVCTPKNVPGFSAVLYYFGERLHKDVGVPIGLINSSWGGSGIEPWTVAGDKSGGMYNGMIAPVKPLAIRGVIWYQGESNMGNGLKYAEKMKALIEGWRQVWGYDFPFYFVQIAPFAGYKTDLAPLWEAQAASLKIPGTGMSVTTDLVENIKDIHPRQKFEVGNRLALWALAKEYKKDLVYSGPLYKAMKVDGNKIVLSFAYADGGLLARDGKPLSEFEIAGADGKFVPAAATIEGATVVVQAKEISSPTQARFGWRNETNPNLVNKAGLPASPFQTNNWQGAARASERTAPHHAEGMPVTVGPTPLFTE